MKKLMIGTAVAAITSAGAAMADGHGPSACLITKTNHVISEGEKEICEYVIRGKLLSLHVSC